MANFGCNTTDLSTHDVYASQIKLWERLKFANAPAALGSGSVKRVWFKASLQLSAEVVSTPGTTNPGQKQQIQLDADSN